MRCFSTRAPHVHGAELQNTYGAVRKRLRYRRNRRPEAARQARSRPWRGSKDAARDALKRQVLKIETEVRERRDGLQLRAFHGAIRLQRKRHIGIGEQGTVVPAR